MIPQSLNEKHEQLNDAFNNVVNHRDELKKQNEELLKLIFSIEPFIYKNNFIKSKLEEIKQKPIEELLKEVQCEM